MDIRIDWLPLGLLLLFFAALFFLRRQQYREPSLLFSSLAPFPSADRSPKVAFSHFFQQLLWLSVGVLAIAFINPSITLPDTAASLHQTEEGAGLYLVVDRSGSMRQSIATPLGTLPKIDFLKRVATTFIEQRPRDLIGLVAFARSAQILAPLTLDHSAVIAKLQGIHVVEHIEEDGTAMGYALYKTINVIDATRYYSQELATQRTPVYTIKSASIVLLTDGFPAPNPEDQNNPLRTLELPEAAEYAKEKGVRLYVVIIDPALTTEEFAPHRRLMQRITEISGGKFYSVDQSVDLEAIFADINTLEKNIFPNTSHPHKQISFSPFFIAAGLLILFISLLSLGTVFRQTP